MGCCGNHWGFGPSPIEEESTLPEEESPLSEPISENGSPIREAINEDRIPLRESIHINTNPSIEPMNDDRYPIRGPMNLAAALAIEPQYWSAQYGRVGPTEPNINLPNSLLTTESVSGTPSRRSLMRLLNETDDDGLKKKCQGEVGMTIGCDNACCVCMRLKKGAAFIPCGHTFCRVCSRGLWVNRPLCPLCNRPIIESSFEPINFSRGN